MTTTVGAGAGLRAHVATEVRAWMARRRISGVKLAQQMGKSQPYLAQRLTGRYAFDVDDLEVICRLLDVPVTALLASAPLEPDGGPTAGRRSVTPAYRIGKRTAMTQLPLVAALASAGRRNGGLRLVEVLRRDQESADHPAEFAEAS